MTPEDRERYSRQIRLAGVGEHGQQRILDAHVVIIGCGALGSFQAGALARAGVGRLTIIDRDYVELNNLHRQWLFEESDAEEALPKAAAAARRLRQINGACVVEPVIADLTPANIDDVCEGAGLILDGTDNFETRYLINDYAVFHDVPWIYGAAVGTYGITMPVLPGRTSCLACVYPEPPGANQPSCETVGVLNAITAAVASLQVANALHLLAQGREAVAPRITTIDVWNGPMRQSAQPDPRPDCTTCGTREFPWLRRRRPTPISLCGRNAVQIHERERQVDLARLQRDLAGVGTVRANEFALRLSIAPYELTVFPDGRAIVKGTTDVGVARSLYSRYVGN
ncbi:MAG TPA: ThiF family adenylyltransferase [Bryobacteraceae bacterium]|nr:ThiF family adenylyltransferase [Bryobacteraceae bacterium]